jgi:diaminopimelate decarboxylase
MKANSSLAMLQVLCAARLRLRHRLRRRTERVLAAGGDPAKVVFSGVGKTRAEMRQALEAGIGCFNVESEAELDVLSEVASGSGQHGARSASASTPTSTPRPTPTSPPA